MFQRHKLEKAEGKSYNEAGVSPCLQILGVSVTKFRLQVSDEMKALNRKFAKLHGYSSLANLAAVLAAAFHGLWIGSKGLGSL